VGRAPFFFKHFQIQFIYYFWTSKFELPVMKLPINFHAPGTGIKVTDPILIMWVNRLGSLDSLFQLTPVPFILGHFSLEALFHYTTAPGYSPVGINQLLYQFSGSISAIIISPFAQYNFPVGSRTRDWVHSQKVVSQWVFSMDFYYTLFGVNFRVISC